MRAKLPRRSTRLVPVLTGLGKVLCQSGNPEGAMVLRQAVDIASVLPPAVWQRKAATAELASCAGGRENSSGRR